jgi:putative transposase
MANHVHLVVTPDDYEQLARFVGSFSQSYSQYRNRSRDSSGKLFEQRYKCVPISTDKQMAVTTVYIELNPVRAQLCKDADAYRWSTHRLHAGHDEQDTLITDLWAPSSWYLSLGRNRRQRALAFRDWFAHYQACDDWSSVDPAPELRASRKRFERPDRRRAI